jgi:uncharacterized protein
MADPTSVEPTSSRRVAQRKRQRRQARNRVVSAALAVVLVAVAALWFSDTLRIPTDGPSFAQSAVSAKPPVNVGTSGGVITQPDHRGITTTDPLRLWIGGDSLAGALGPALAGMTAATGVVQPQYDSRVGSGLITGNVDWPKHAQEQMDELDPEAVVFIIGTNDANVYDERQAAEYTQKTEEMMRILVGNGREVYWVNAPVMREKRLEDNIKKVDLIQRAVAAKIPEITFVDAHTLFADETGAYQSSFPDDTGHRVTMRAGDGIHLTGAGGEHLAREIYDTLDQRWNITERAVAGQPKKVLVTPGSEQVPGSGGSSGSSSSGSGGQSSSSNRSSAGVSNMSSGAANTTSTTATAVTTPPPPSTQPATTTTTTSPASTPPTS